MRKLLLIFFAGMALFGCGATRNAGSRNNQPRRFHDISLVGYWHREPHVWDAARFSPHVSWNAPDGKEQWLFEGFLFLEGSDWLHGRTFVLGPGKSAAKEQWQYQLDLWLGAGGCVANLEKACADVASRIGKPSSRRGVIIGIPDAIMFETFSDKKSSTTYWGSLDGRQLDFASVEDRMVALRWYIDSARKMFKALKPRYLELAGFYITSEEIYLPYDIDVNCKYKNWDLIAPALAGYCHSAGEGLYWIPYHMGPGYKYWKQLGIDQAWMQPNWYWDLRREGRHPFPKTMAAIKEYGMGMELEFEYSGVAAQMTEGKMGPDGDGRLVFSAADVPALQDRVRQYMKEYKDAGLYGSGSIALYSGSNALTQLAESSLPEDRKLYDEICGFILGNRGEVSQDGICISVDEYGSLKLLSLGEDGYNYAGGGSLWRMYYNTPERKEIELTAEDGTPMVSREGDRIRIDYNGLGGKAFNLHLTIWAENGQARFAAEVENNEPHTIIRELQFPLVGGLQIPSDYKLLTTHTGGQIFNNPVRTIANVSTRALYMTPAQKFRQYDLQYPRNAASNCFAFVGETDGLYFGSHDPSFQQTWHGLRAYPEKGMTGLVTEDFHCLEAGFYRYPNIMCGEKWRNDASVIVPYKGDWTATSRIYRAWADSWWDKQPVPRWVQDMTGWQRIIFKHQYGEYLRHYEDLPGRIYEAGSKAGSDAVLAFGWWKEGMDNGYPNYSPDDSQGGDTAWKKQIADFKAKGGRLLLYYNGRLIDNESEFYRSGEASKVSNHDNTGDEFTEHYKFTGEGTTLGYYDSRTFVIADMSKRAWRNKLIDWADRAMALGANSVFYDQLGVAEEFPNWNLSREYPVPDIFTGRYKADALREIRDHIKARDPEFCLGTEWLSDCTSRYCDYVHIVEFTALPESFPEWFRYTFPEVIWSDRCVRDEVDMVRRVNNTLVKGLRNDIEVFRCRGLIDETPAYQEYLGKINAIRHKYPELLMEGRFAWHDDFSMKGSGDITACEFAGKDRIAIVLTSEKDRRVKTRLNVPGYVYEDCETLGDASVKSGRDVSLGQYGVAVVVFRKEDR